MRILLTADFHLDFKQYGFTERLEDFMLSVAYVFHQAQVLKVDTIIIAGDMFQGVHPSGQAVYFLRLMVQRAQNAGIQVLGVDGNHDSTANMWMQVCGITPLDMGNPLACMGRYPVAAVNGWAPCSVENGPAGQLHMVGINGCPASMFRTRLAAIAAEFAKNNRRLDILVIHQALAELCGFDGADLTAAEIVSALAPVGTRLVLMGDIHDYHESVFGDVRFIYPGSTEVNSTTEKPQKSFSIIDIDDTTLSTALYPVPVRPSYEMYVTEPGQLDRVLADLQSARVDDRMPMAIVSYDPDKLPDFRKTAQAVLNGHAIYRLIPRPAGVLGTDIFAQLSQKTFERHGAMNNMRTVLLNSFGADSDEFALILRCMEQPDNIVGVVAEYAKSKGITIT